MIGDEWRGDRSQRARPANVAGRMGDTDVVRTVEAAPQAKDVIDVKEPTQNWPSANPARPPVALVEGVAGLAAYPPTRVSTALTGR